MDKTRKHLAFGVANKAYISKRAAATQKLKQPLGQLCFISVTKRLRVWCANQRGSYYYKQRLSYQGNVCLKPIKLSGKQAKKRLPVPCHNLKHLLLNNLSLFLI